MSNIWKRVCYWILTWYVQRTPQVLLVFSELRPRYVWGSNPAKTISRLCELGTLSGWPRLGKFTTETIGGTQVIFWHIGGAMAEFNDWPIKPWLFLVTMENPPTVSKAMASDTFGGFSIVTLKYQTVARLLPGHEGRREGCSWSRLAVVTSDGILWLKV